MLFQRWRLLTVWCGRKETLGDTGRARNGLTARPVCRIHPELPTCTVRCQYSLSCEEQARALRIISTVSACAVFQRPATLRSFRTLLRRISLSNSYAEIDLRLKRPESNSAGSEEAWLNSGNCSEQGWCSVFRGSDARLRVPSRAVAKRFARRTSERFM